MRRLGIDTSTPVVSVAVVDGARAVSLSIPAAVGHGEALAPAVADGLSQLGLRPADLDEIVVGVGPGPFTGLRVGVVTALVMGYALEIPVVGVCSLDAIARDVMARDEAVAAQGFAVMTDARRKEIYWAVYDSAGVRRGEPAVGTAAAVAAELTQLGVVVAVGAGASLYGDVLRDNGLQVLHPMTPDAAQLIGCADNPVLRRPVVPLYLRRPDAVEPGRPKAVGT